MRVPLALLSPVLMVLSSCSPDVEDALSVESTSRMVQSTPPKAKHRRRIYPPGTENQMMMDKETTEAQQTGQAVQSLLWPPFPPAPRATPSIQKIYGLNPQPTPGPTAEFAVVELKIGNFDPVSPPKVYIYDDEAAPGSDPYFVIEWLASTGDLKTETVAIPLAPDPLPGTRSGHSPPTMAHFPLARRSRIELYHWFGGTIQTAFVTLKQGVFVVPVTFHDVVESYNWSEILARRLRIVDVFWRVPTTYPGWGDINSVWKQADVQFHLVTNGTNYNVVNPGQSDLAETECRFLWDAPPPAPPAPPTYDVPNAVDLYSVQRLNGGEAHMGWGGCYHRGFVAVRDYSLQGTYDLHGSSELIAHEFGHYLGSLGRDTNMNLVNDCACYPNVTTTQQNTMKENISIRVFQPPLQNQDYNKHL